MTTILYLDHLPETQVNYTTRRILSQKFLAIDGTACTTKTTIIEKIGKTLNHVEVHLDDFDQLAEKYNFGENHAANSVFFAMKRTMDAYKYNLEKGHLCDREPVAGMLYQLIFNNVSTESAIQDLQKVIDTGINEYWHSIILLVKEGQEELALQKMIERDNKWDWFDVEYVKQQNRVFKIWAGMNKYPTVEIDYTLPFEPQQDKIMDMINDFFKDRNNDGSYVQV